MQHDDHVRRYNAYNPLRGLSGVCDEDGHEMTFEELKALCERDIRAYDASQGDWGRERRLRMQLANDPNYKPLAPGEGMRARKVWR